jgi:hypothetical protein
VGLKTGFGNWRMHIDMTEGKAFRKFIRAYFLFRSEQLSINNKLTPHKALNRSVMIYVLSA